MVTEATAFGGCWWYIVDVRYIWSIDYERLPEGKDVSQICVRFQRGRDVFE